jgi:hypothetical protein
MSKSFLILAFLVGISAVAGLCVGVTEATAQASTPNIPGTSFHLAVGTTIPTELSKSLDLKKLKRGDPFELRTTASLLSNNRVVLPERTRIRGHVTDVKVSSKGEPESEMGISFDSMVLPDGHEVEFHAALQAIGKHLVSEYSVPMPGGGGGVITQPDNPGMGTTTRLSSRDEGVIGLPELTLATFVHGGLIRSKSKNVRLEAGSQFLLRVTSEQSMAGHQKARTQMPLPLIALR